MIDVRGLGWFLGAGAGAILGLLLSLPVGAVAWFLGGSVVAWGGGTVGVMAFIGLIFGGFLE